MSIKMDNNTDNIEEKKTLPQDAPPREGSHPGWVWFAVLAALVAWALLAWSNGYVAMGIAAVGVLAGFIGARHSSLAMKRLAITAIIASTVLLVVIAAYLIVLKVGLG